ncbi:flagellar basal body L-ring protein FlgH [Rhodobacterales bacterium HKCCE2091]|nr:flagellar basal body L-ring protein FlgH [Rhodobacterales bacterium HKCCE2091]
MTLLRRPRRIVLSLLVALSAVAGCTRLENVGRLPELTPAGTGDEVIAMASAPFPGAVDRRRVGDGASLWTAGRRSLLGDRRAQSRGDILTVVIEIDDSASISNASDRSRSGSENLSLNQLFGIPQRIDDRLPIGASSADAVDIAGNSASSGQGSVTRNEQLTLRIAVTVTEVLPNGVLRIQGTQEVRVNYEVRELTITGYVRPEDVSRLNEITYDKIAAARISYGGRGQISDVQQPRYGQQVADILLPF